MHPITFVFDIDDTLGLHFIDEQYWRYYTYETSIIYGREFTARHRLDCCGYPHFVFVGIPELWRWLHGQGCRLATFSSGDQRRNTQFVQGLARMAFGDRAESIVPGIRVFSREACFDTTRFSSDEGDSYQPVFHGNKKKIMTNVVAPPEDMPWTLLIDDDKSYMALHEEYNLIAVNCEQNMSPCRLGKFEEFGYYYKAFYLAGILQIIIETVRQAHCTPVEAARLVQFDSVDCELDRKFDYPTKGKLKYYLQGERILSAIDPEVRICRKARRIATIFSWLP